MALKQIPNPYGIPWRMFIDTLVGFNPSLIPNVSPDEPWQDTADRLVQYEQAAPRPDGYAQWQEWAAALKRAYPD